MASIPEAADVVVVGGGPAGSTAATILAMDGLDVVLLEKDRHPRPVVGESLIPDFWKFTDATGASDAIMNEGFVHKGGAVVSWNGQNRAHTFDDFGYERPALHVEREIFDDLLLTNAKEKSVSVFEEANVTGAEFSVDGSGREWSKVSYRTDGEVGEITCRYVIDASGQSAVLGRQTGNRSLDEDFRYLGIWGYWEGSRFFSIDGVAHDGHELGAVRPVTFLNSIDEADDSGWSWHIKLRESSSVGLVLPPKVAAAGRNPGESWADYFERRCRAVPVLGDLLAESTLIEGSVSTIRDYSHKSSAVAGPGWFMAGDAAGFVDPIFSVGVVLALYGGSVAAWAVKRALANPGSADHIRNLFESQLQGRIEVARSLALPGYQSGREVSQRAKDVISLERSGVKNTMYVVSEFTTRSDNWRRIVDSEAPDLTSDQMRIIDRLVY